MKKKTDSAEPLDPAPIEDEKDDTFDELAALAKNIEYPLDEAKTPVKSGYQSGFEDVNSGQEEDEKDDTFDRLAALAKNIEYPSLDEAKTPVKSGYQSGFEDVNSGQEEDEKDDTFDELAALAKNIEYPSLDEAKTPVKSGYQSGFEDVDSGQEDDEKDDEENIPIKSDVNLEKIIKELENLPISAEDRATIIRELEESLEPLAQKTTKEPQTELEALDFKEFENFQADDPTHLQGHVLEPLSMPPDQTNEKKSPVADPFIPDAFKEGAAAAINNPVEKKSEAPSGHDPDADSDEDSKLGAK